MAIEWENLTASDWEALNEDAYIRACDYLRSAKGDHVAAEAAIMADIRYNQSVVKAGQKARARKLDKAHAASAAERLDTLGMVRSFIWDVEI